MRDLIRITYISANEPVFLDPRVRCNCLRCRNLQTVLRYAKAKEHTCQTGHSSCAQQITSP